MSIDADNRRTAADLLAAARARLRRLEPAEAAAAAAAGAVLVDIRPPAQRAAEGTVPGSIAIERNVLEWRLDPAEPARVPQMTGHDIPVVVFCSEGYTSSLAAASLQELGLSAATDIVGGFWAWVTAGLPAADVGAPAGVDGGPPLDHPTRPGPIP